MVRSLDVQPLELTHLELSVREEPTGMPLPPPNFGIGATGNTRALPEEPHQDVEQEGEEHRRQSQRV